MKFLRSFSWLLFLFWALGGVFFTSIIGFAVDWWWFSEVGYTDIFITSFTTQLITGVSAGAITGVILLSNLLLAATTKHPWVVFLPPSLVGHQFAITDRLVKRISIAISVLVAIAVGFLVSFSWQQLLQFIHATPFGAADPIFHQDISFYLFSLPIYTLAIKLTKIILFITIAACVTIYLLRKKLSFGSLTKNLSQQPSDATARIHVAVLLFLFLISLAASKYLSIYSLLTAQNAPVFGANFTDITIMIPLLQGASAVLVVCALMALLYGIKGTLKPLFGAGLLIVIVNVVTIVLPPLFQKLIVAPNEFAKETPFIKHNIAATREAYGLTDIEKKGITTDKSLTAADIEANNPTIKNVRLWDRDQLLSTFSQIQEIRTYYEFASVDNDRYTIDGEMRQIMLSPRELASDSLPNKNWINEHLTFTHGYGIAAGPVNQVTPEGLPVLFVKDLPPKTEVSELAIQQPEIYYGELSNNYVIVNSKAKEFDYPKGEENVYATYKGTGGVPVDSLIKRLIFAAQFSSLKMLLSEDLTNESRIMYNRNIKERVAKIAPFLTYDHDPYSVIANGKLYWMLDAYTATDRYPYAQQSTLNGTTINYIKNSVKVVVDAHNGSVTFYQADANDPIIQTYAKSFPQTFKPLSAMPKELLAHIRYPEDIFTVQTEIFTTYHMTDPQIFYNKEDQWEVPTIASTSDPQQTAVAPAMTPRHMIMKLPGVASEEYILMLPFTPRSKDNLSAWMVARNDAETYGKLVVYTFPKDKLVFGPKQIIGRINQDAEVSRQISLWDQRGSQVIQGPLLVIPIEQSLVYIRPLYLKAESGKIPELKRVIVAYENRIAMEATLEQSLGKIFGSDTTQESESKTNEQNTSNPNPTPAPDTKQGATAELDQAKAAYENAITAQRDGDWARYGEEIKKLGDLLQQLQK